jgi:hypothetical protein
MTAPDLIQITHQPRAMTTPDNRTAAAPAPGENLAAVLREADMDHVEQLAAIIRRVDGNNSMDAAALAEAILDRYPLAFLVDPPATPPSPDPGEVQVCTAGVSIEPLGDAAHLTFQDAIHLVEGCHTYSGGHSGTEGEAWHGAIDTVVAVLKRAAVGPWDSQLTAVYGVGSEAQAGEVEA